MTLLLVFPTHPFCEYVEVQLSPGKSTRLPCPRPPPGLSERGVISSRGWRTRMLRLATICRRSPGTRCEDPAPARAALGAAMTSSGAVWRIDVAVVEDITEGTPLSSFSTT